MPNWIKDIIDYFSFSTTNEASAEASSSIINFMIEDPTMPELTRKMNLPQDPTALPMSVTGLKRADPASCPQAVHAFVSIATAIEHFQKKLSTMNKPLSRWAATSKLMVFPLAGKDFNAYYDRESLKFFYDQDQATRKMIYAANGTDVVSHETGHAFLDILRSDFWSVQALEIWAFHEAFAENSFLGFFSGHNIIRKSRYLRNKFLLRSHRHKR